MNLPSSPLVPPELLMPAGGLDKLKVAISYGADAVYLGGEKFGLRTAAENFTPKEIEEGVTYAHLRKAKVYVVLNGFLHDSDLSSLPEFVKFLEEVGVDAVIVSDLGVIKTVRQHSQLEIHLSTQASCLNSFAAAFWKSQGVKRIVVGREISIAQASEIGKKAGVEIEMFAHGSLCMAYSGNCVISNYTSGRDSNRGGCAQSCRFEYQIERDGEETLHSHFMSSKDLRGVEYIPQFFERGIHSLKVEGRMKSLLYAGSIAKYYREAIDSYSAGISPQSTMNKYWLEEINKVAHRGYTSGSLMTKADADSVYSPEEAAEENQYFLAGQVLENWPGEFMLVQVRGAFNLGDELELIPFRGTIIKMKVEWMNSLSGESLERSRPSTLVKLPSPQGAEVLNIIRKRKF